jgi:uncharacterized HhH-GPD family protein
MEPTPLAITGDAAADELLNTHPFALLLGMLLDQQVPMEWAFKGPDTLRNRLGSVDPEALVGAGPEAFQAAFSTKPALHRFPGSMGGRAYALAEFVVAHYGGDTAAIWRDAPSGAELYRRVRELPGYGDEKAKIFVAILGKRFDVRPEGWREAAGAFGDDTPRSVADIDGPESLARVREWKKLQKAKGKSKQE